MILRHVGIRPTHELQVLDFKRKIFIEEFPDGSYNLWNIKMLKSGCNWVIKETHELMDCYYCPACNEWFSKNQWESVSEGSI